MLLVCLIFSLAQSAEAGRLCVRLAAVGSRSESVSGAGAGTTPVNPLAGLTEGTAVTTPAATPVAAEDSLRTHATGLMSAALAFTRQATDMAVNKGFGNDLLRRLREGPVADHLREEATAVRVSKQGGHVVGDTDAADTGSLPLGSTAPGGKSDGDSGAATVAANGTIRAAEVGAVVGGGGRNFEQWSSLAAVEAEHVVACLSAIGGYQEILAPLFGGNGLAVLDLLLEQPRLEMRLHTVEILSALLAHKKVGLAFVRRGWVDTLLQLGASRHACFLESEIAFCLHGLANSAGVMEAVCRLQGGSLERLLEYAAGLLRSTSESTQKNALQFWDCALRFPPALEAFEQHGGVSKLLYLLLPTTVQ
ncbi:unnamed protein product, partial [Sphacelaria rigidula]